MKKISNLKRMFSILILFFVPIFLMNGCEKDDGKIKISKEEYARLKRLDDLYVNGQGIHKELFNMLVKDVEIKLQRYNGRVFLYGENELQAVIFFGNQIIALDKENLDVYFVGPLLAYRSEHGDDRLERQFKNKGLDRYGIIKFLTKVSGIDFSGPIGHKVLSPRGRYLLERNPSTNKMKEILDKYNYKNL